MKLMKFNKNSIAFRTIFYLLSLSILFILFIGLVMKNVFSNAYMDVEKEKVNIILENIQPSIALNMSYDFKDAINEIANKTLNNKNVLLLKIQNSDNNETQLFTNDKLSLQNYKQNGEIIKVVKLEDPATKKIIGQITLVYSNHTYKKYMSSFYKWFFLGIFGFFISIVLLAFTLYKSLKNLTLLDNSLKLFNPKLPKKLKLDIKTKDEVASISKSANIMIENIIDFLNHEDELYQRLKQNETHLKDAQRMAKVGSFDYDIVNDELVLSDEYYRILGLDYKYKLTWKKFLSMVVQDDYIRVSKILNNSIENGSTFNIKYGLKTEKSKYINIQTKGKVRKKKSGFVHLTAISMDITEDVENKKTIEKLAYYDALTGLANRTLLKDRMHKGIYSAKRTKQNMGILFLDLDHFKLINDTLGHSVGDDLLVYVSDLLEKHIRKADTLSRFGGDEFVIYFPSLSSSKDAQTIAYNIQKALQKKHTIGKHELYITTSIGIALYPEHGQTCEELIRNADTAMYEAKNGGRNQFKVYTQSMGNFVEKQMDLEQDLVKAIKTKTQIEVFLQPKIDAHTKIISGAEALVRWRHPKKGLIFPDDFIHIAESTGQMIELGNIITELAILQVKELKDLGFEHLKIAINLSARQFQDSNLVPFVKSMLKKYSVSTSQIEFEVTESISMTNLITTQTILNELKNAGFTIAIDDFGTGHSSLAYLKKFPINTLKIDKSFVMDILDDEEDRIIAQTIVSMAHTLGMKTVAEGVETKEHVDMLCDMGCDILQGYYYSKPISKDEFFNFILNI